MAFADDPSAAYYNGADRHFIFGCGEACLTQGFSHVFLIFFHILQI
jgi:hypothetical protein